MRVGLVRSGCFVALLLATFLTARADTPFAGTFTDGKLTVDLSTGNGAYTGTISLGDKKFPATAQLHDKTLEGTFTAGESKFPFTATMDGDNLVLVSANTTYRTHRVGPANPLAGGADTKSPGLRVINSTDFGQVLGTDKPDAPDVKSGLEATFPDLATFFGNKPKPGGAYVDAKDHKTGGATFTVTYKDQPMRGVINCKMVDHGAAIVVIYCKADAPKDAWAKLTAAPAPATQPADAGSSAALKNYDFPDGTGSIGLADGWSTTAQSAVTPIFIQGPNEETISLGGSFAVSTPDSPTLKMMDQNNASMVKMGGKPTPRPLTMYVAEFSDPATAIVELWPQMSKANEAKGGPAAHIDKIVSQQEVKTNFPNAKAADIVFEVTRTKDGKSAQYRNRIVFQMMPLMTGSWMMLMRGFSAPAERYDQDAPTMLAMIKSMKVNQEVAAKVAQQMIDAQNRAGEAMRNQMAQASQQQLAANAAQFQHDQDQRFADHQAYMQQTQAGYDAHNQQFRDDQLAKSRHDADEVEMIRGYRTVVDTQTGQSASANYYNVTGIVDSLNAAANDPNRFVQIPLRDELYPVTPAK